MDLFTIALIVFLLCYGLSVFIGERLFVVVAGVAAIVAAILLLVRGR